MKVRKPEFQFTYSNYKFLLKKMKELAEIQLFRNWIGGRVFLLRHDVDFNLDLAHRMAVIENGEGVLSTYFILVTSPCYNVLCKKNRELIRSIIEMGHEIGLHFDPSIYTADLEVALKQELETLSHVTNDTVSSISLHNPSIHGKYPLFDGYVNAYDPAFFSDYNYISDSRYSFRGKNIYEFIKNVSETMIQIVIHPMHFSETGQGYDEVIPQAFMAYMNDIHKIFLVNTTYRDQVGDDIIAVLRQKLI